MRCIETPPYFSSIVYNFTLNIGPKIDGTSTLWMVCATVHIARKQYCIVIQCLAVLCCAVMLQKENKHTQKRLRSCSLAIGSKRPSVCIVKPVTLMRGDANYNLQILIISIKIYSCPFYFAVWIAFTLLFLRSVCVLLMPSVTTTSFPIATLLLIHSKCTLLYRRFDLFFSSMHSLSLSLSRFIVTLNNKTALILRTMTAHMYNKVVMFFCDVVISSVVTITIILQNRRPYVSFGNLLHYMAAFILTFFLFCCCRYYVQ